MNTNTHTHTPHTKETHIRRTTRTTSTREHKRKKQKHKHEKRETCLLHRMLHTHSPPLRDATVFFIVLVILRVSPTKCLRVVCGADGFALPLALWPLGPGRVHLRLSQWHRRCISSSQKPHRSPGGCDVQTSLTNLQRHVLSLSSRSAGREKDTTCMHNAAAPKF